MELIRDTDLLLINHYKANKASIVALSEIYKLKSIKNYAFFGDQFLQFIEDRLPLLKDSCSQLSHVEAFYLSNLRDTYYGVFLDLKSELEEVDPKSASSLFIPHLDQIFEHLESEY